MSAAGTATRDNNFDALRILAAAAVIYGHAHVLAAHPAVTVLGNAVESMAVKIFFVISGFLVANSWVFDSSPWRYLGKRCLRIFPGLLLLMLVTVLVLGPLVTTVALSEYFSSGATWRYMSYNIALYPAYGLPGVFADNIFPAAVNGSLWSLPVEFLMYLLFPVIFTLSRAGNSNRLLIAFTLALSAGSLYFLRVSPLTTPLSFYGTGLSGTLDAAPYFFIGSLYSVTRLKRGLSPAVALFLIAVAALLQPVSALGMELALYVLLPFCVLSFATQAAPVISRAGRFGDPSYGIYLYGFVIQQTVYHFAGKGMTPLENALVSIPIAGALAYMSWHLVEKRALKLKPGIRRQEAMMVQSAEIT